MLFEELVEQHRVHRLVAHGISFALVITGHQIGVHLFHFLSHKAELRDAFRIHVRFVLEGHRVECQQYVACVAHRLNVLLETLGGRCHAKLTVAIYNNGRARNRRPANASDECRSLRSLLTDANSVGFSNNTSVENIDVVIARGEIFTSVIAQCDVVVAGCVANERSKTIGSVAFAGGIMTKRIKPSAVLLLPVVLLYSALTPIAVLKLPVVLSKSASAPVAVFKIPVVFDVSASSPRNVLLCARSQPS